METDTIIYFHPTQGQMHKNTAAKKHWWQDAALREEKLGLEKTGGFFLSVDCAIPPYYYKKKPWTGELLSAAMEEVVHRADGMADAFLHPDIMTYMSEKFRERWEMRRDTFERLSACLLAACASGPLHEKGRVAVLLGKPEETDWQMELTQNLLLPYLSRINSLLFYYEEVAGTDIWEEMAAYLETYDYEYGLVPAMHPYSTGEEGLCCGRERCSGVILDFANTARHPRLEREDGTVYVDLTSDRERERSCMRKNGHVLYVSPLKYLDTIVKTGYDR